MLKRNLGAEVDTQNAEHYDPLGVFAYPCSCLYERRFLASNSA